VVVVCNDIVSDHFVIAGLDHNLVFSNLFENDYLSNLLFASKLCNVINRL